MTANQIAYMRMREERRANLAKERLTKEAQEEAARHNVASEEINSRSVQESKRHNLISESIDRGALSLNSEVRTAEVGVKQQEANIKQQEADTRERSVIETERHNYATEFNEVGSAMWNAGQVFLNNQETIVPALFASNERVRAIRRKAEKVLNWLGLPTSTGRSETQRDTTPTGVGKVTLRRQGG